jgi:hypothetical protein
MTMAASQFSSHINQMNLIQKAIDFCIINNMFTKNDHEKIAIIKRGLCFGFSLCHSGMAASGKLDWWQAALCEIAKWDGKKESLANPTNLPGVDNKIEERPGAQFGLTGNTLGALIERVLVNYVFINFADEPLNKLLGATVDDKDKVKFTLGNTITQGEILMPRVQGGFEVINSKNERMTVQDNIKAICPIDSLEEVLASDDFVSTDICMIHSHDHACSWRVENNTWYFYDPNNHQGEISFSNKKEFINEIKKVLVNADPNDVVKIQVASLTRKFSLELKQKYDSATIFPEQITGKGLRMILTNRPDCLPELLDKIAINPKSQENFAMALIQQPDCWTGLHHIAMDQPKCLPKLFYLVDINPSVAQSFAEAISQKDNVPGLTGLHVIVEKASANCMEKLFDLIEKNGVIKREFTDALFKTDHNDLSAFEAMVRYKPASLPRLYAMIEKDPSVGLGSLSFNVGEELGRKSDKIHGSMVHQLAKFAPDSLPCLFKLIKNKPDMLMEFGYSLKKRDSNGISGVRMLLMHAPTCLQQLVDLGNTNSDFRSLLIDALQKTHDLQSHPMDITNDSKNKAAKSLIEHESALTILQLLQGGQNSGWVKEESQFASATFREERNAKLSCAQINQVLINLGLNVDNQCVITSSAPGIFKIMVDEKAFKEFENSPEKFGKLISYLENKHLNAAEKVIKPDGSSGLGESTQKEISENCEKILEKLGHKVKDEMKLDSLLREHQTNSASLKNR